MPVLTRARVTSHAEMYQLVPLIMIRVTVAAHAFRYVIVLSVVVHVLVFILVTRCKMPPSEKDRATEAAKTANTATTTAILVPRCKMPPSEMDRATEPANLVRRCKIPSSEKDRVKVTRLVNLLCKCEDWKQ